MHIVNLNMVWTPDYLHVDMQKSNINALSTFFPGADISCCYFHATQSIRRKFKKEGLDYVLNGNGLVNLLFNVICGNFSNEPHRDHLYEIFDELCSLMDNEDERRKCIKICEYSKKYYFNETAVFPSQLWNYPADEEYIRTNNVAESGNARAKASLQGITQKNLAQVSMSIKKFKIAEIYETAFKPNAEIDFVLLVQSTYNTRNPKDTRRINEIRRRVVEYNNTPELWSPTLLMELLIDIARLRK